MDRAITCTGTLFAVAINIEALSIATQEVVTLVLITECLDCNKMKSAS